MEGWAVLCVSHCIKQDRCTKEVLRIAFEVGDVYNVFYKETRTIVSAHSNSEVSNTDTKWTEPSLSDH